MKRISEVGVSESQKLRTHDPWHRWAHSVVGGGNSRLMRTGSLGRSDAARRDETRTIWWMWVRIALGLLASKKSFASSRIGRWERWARTKYTNGAQRNAVNRITVRQSHQSRDTERFVGKASREGDDEASS